VKRTLEGLKNVFSRCRKFFLSVFLNRKTLFRDLLILTFVIIFWSIFLFTNIDFNTKKTETNPASENVQEQEEISEIDPMLKQKEDIANIQAKTDISAWTNYQNLWYGFTLKYPDSWSDPVVQKPVIGNNWEQKINFRMKQTEEANPFEGFDVKIYSIQKIKNVSNVEEFPKLKTAELSDDEQCATIDGHFLETGDYPAEEVYIPISDFCFNASLFFTNTRDAYIYVIVPKIKDGAGLAGDPSLEIVSHLPEFFSIISTWNLVDIQRPKPVIVKPKITAPKPVSYKKENGRMVCAKKNDKPSKSSKGKGKHLDMECCLDPDENPNPWCYYSKDKYGKYL